MCVGLGSEPTPGHSRAPTVAAHGHRLLRHRLLRLGPRGTHGHRLSRLHWLAVSPPLPWLAGSSAPQRRAGGAGPDAWLCPHPPWGRDKAGCEAPRGELGSAETSEVEPPTL